MRIDSLPLAILGVLTYGVLPMTAQAAPERFQRYAPRELVRIVRAGEAVYFIDVREPGEYAEEHIPGAVNIPRAQLDEATQLFPKDALLIPHCKMDFRGFIVARTLRELGFIRVGLMQERGLEGWRRSGLPVAGSRVGLSDAEALERLAWIPLERIPGGREIVRVSPTGMTRTFELTTAPWHFDPNDLTVQAGDHVRLIITSAAGNHWFVLPEFEAQAELPEGRSTEVVFFADQPGEFWFGSCEVAGGMVQMMKGRLRVVQ